jgi:hypothetical protein
MREITNNYNYFDAFLKESYKIIHEEDQTSEIPDIIRETEGHQSDLEEKETRDMAEQMEDFLRGPMSKEDFDKEFYVVDDVN